MFFSPRYRILRVVNPTSHDIGFLSANESTSREPYIPWNKILSAYEYESWTLYPDIPWYRFFSDNESYKIRVVSIHVVNSMSRDIGPFR